MFILYDLIFLLFTLICLPVYLLKGKFHQGFAQRAGILRGGDDLKRPIWVHAVSLGEAIAVAGLVEGLRKVYPAKKFVISTVTPTGNKIARNLAKRGDLVTYLPLDFSFIVRRVINRINPGIFIIAETEIWPNLITCLHRKNIPIVTVNARISDNSFRGYSAIKPLISPILNKVSLFCAQADTDAVRLRQLGVAAEKIRVTGNMKFDIHDCADLEKYRAEYRDKLGMGPGNRLLVAGSTHRGEEGTILAIYKKLLPKFPGLRLLLCPRHPERAGEVEKIVSKSGFNALRISRSNRPTGQPANRPTIFILDTVGNLMNFYCASDIVFVGGSLIKKGGHNILEPASCGKPVIFGPYMFNFRDISRMFLEKNSAIMARTPEELEGGIRRLSEDTGFAAAMGERAAKLIAGNRGAALRNIEAIKTMGALNGN
ncbi:MAG: 3-deoxy-D-manno-octulosonic acid transferase [Candidatus Omnitrophota bacterium]